MVKAEAYKVDNLTRRVIIILKTNILRNQHAQSEFSLVYI